MPIIMKKKCTIVGSYTDEQKQILEGLIKLFRTSVFDDDSDKNILDRKISHYTDAKIIALLERAMNDINGGSPVTNFSIYSYIQGGYDNTLIVDGAVIFALIGEGILQLRNQVNFNDSGLSIGLFDKTQLYQSWYSMLLQNYIQGKQTFKGVYLARMQPSIFHGISSEFAYYNNWWDDYD